jgi:type IV pilus assembly protein PilB
MNTGYKGRIGIFEVLVIDEMIADMIVKNKSAQEIARAARETGNFTTLKQNVAQKIAKGITTIDEASSVVMT